MENSIFDQFMSSQQQSAKQSSPIEADLKASVSKLFKEKGTEIQVSDTPKSVSQKTSKYLTSSASDIRNFLRAEELREEVSHFNFSAPRKFPLKTGANLNFTPHNQEQSGLPKREKNSRAKIRRSTPAKHKTTLSIFPHNHNNFKGATNPHNNMQSARIKEKRKLSDETNTNGEENKRNKDNGMQNDCNTSDFKNTQKQHESIHDDEDAEQKDQEEDESNKMDCAEALPPKHNEEAKGTVMADPNSLSLEVVFSMFKKLQIDIDDLKKENCTKKVEDANIHIARHTEEIRGINFEQLQHQDKLNKIETDLDLFKTKTEIMSGMIQRMDVVLKEQATKLDRMEMDKAKCSIIIKNLYSGPKIIDAKLEVYKLLYQDMQVDVTVNDIYFQAQYTPRPIVVVFLNTDHKKRVFGALKKIAHIKNKDGKKYIFQDFYTPEVNDNRNRFQQIYEMYQGSEAQQNQITATNTELKIGSQTYKKKVCVPTVQEVLAMDLDEIRNVLAIKVNQGKQINEQSSAFLGFSIPAQSFEQVRQAYAKLKIVHAGARHIVCAFSLPGQEKHHCNDYCNDGEYGAGKNLLKLLLDNNITSRAVFVVRYCQGQKIGSVRHKCFAQAATEVINANKYNKYTKTAQEVSIHYIEQGFQATATKGKAPFKSVFKRKEQHQNKASTNEQSVPKTVENTDNDPGESFSYLRKFTTPASMPGNFRSSQNTPTTENWDNNLSIDGEQWSARNSGSWPKK